MFRFLRYAMLSLLAAGVVSAAPGRLQVEKNPRLLDALNRQRHAIRQQLIHRGYRPNAPEKAELAVPRELEHGLTFPIAPGVPVMAQKGTTPFFSPNSHDRGLRYSLDLSLGPRSGPVPIASPGRGVAYVYDGARINTKDNWGFGNTVVVDHQNGFASVLSHLRDVSVRTGQQLSTGQPVGTMGSTGNAGNEHLHFQVSELTRTPNPAHEMTQLRLGRPGIFSAPPWGQSVPVPLFVRALSTQYQGSLDMRLFVTAHGGQTTEGKPIPWDMAHWYAAP